MSEIEIPDEAVRDYLNARYGDSSRENGRGEAAEIVLAAVLPSLRRQVLESVVEDVAKIGVGDNGWAILHENVRERRRQSARRVLGLDGES